MMKWLAVLLAGTFLMITCAACGSSINTTNSLCAASGCAGVRGVVEQCAVLPHRSCRLVRPQSITLLDSHGRESARAGSSERGVDPRFYFGALIPGRYSVEVIVAGKRWRLPVTVRRARIAWARVVIQPN